ncbi:MAG: ABC transporter substrate-binding protein [Acidobacteria bacterium]|nr:ABC transporter substrate-binding protein [Acidobacteriota bacterium]
MAGSAAACTRTKTAAGTGAGANAASPHRALYMLEGPGRDARIVEGARTEGLVTMYTSLNTQDSVPLTDAFEKKYGVKTELWRSSSERVVQRALIEARARRFTCDVMETNGPEMEALYREGLLDEFRSPHFADLAPAAFPTHRHYIADRFNFFTIGYNTTLVKPDEVPNTYDDLLHPRFVGRIGLEAGDVDWFGAMMKHMGEAEGPRFFRTLAEHKPQIRSGHTLMGQLVASGEVPLAANIYNHNAERLVVQGAPIAWKALTPTFGRPNAIGLARHARHPYAAVLFADFVLSQEGQTILKDHNRVPSSLAVNSRLNAFPFEMIDPAITLDENEKWSKIWSDLFLRGQRVPREVDG